MTKKTENRPEKSGLQILAEKYNEKENKEYLQQEKAKKWFIRFFRINQLKELKNKILAKIKRRKKSE